MYRISEFSKITSLTTKALRYYDDQGILKPSFRGENAYRYYTDQDFRKANLIRMLRELDFSIAEIKDLLENYEGTEDMNYYLQEKKNMIQRKIEQEELLIHKINEYMDPQLIKEKESSYSVEIKQYDPINVTYIRFQGKYTDVSKYMGSLYKQAKNKAAGPPFNCYYDPEFKEYTDMEICLPLKEEIPHNEKMYKCLPAMNAVSTIHHGSYDSLNFAYKALLDYAEKHGKECLVPSREIYLKGPGMIFRGNPHKYTTEIAIPVKD